MFNIHGLTRCNSWTAYVFCIVFALVAFPTQGPDEGWPLRKRRVGDWRNHSWHELRHGPTTGRWVAHINCESTKRLWQHLAWIGTGFPQADQTLEACVLWYIPYVQYIKSWFEAGLSVSHMPLIPVHLQLAVPMLSLATKMVVCHLRHRRQWSCWSGWGTRKSRTPPNPQPCLRKSAQPWRSAWGSWKKWKNSLRREVTQPLSARISEHNSHSHWMHIVSPNKDF